MKKKGINIYRTINGIRFEQITSDPAIFDILKSECKLENKKYRIINGEFLKEKK